MAKQEPDDLLEMRLHDDPEWTAQAEMQKGDASFVSATSEQTKFFWVLSDNKAYRQFVDGSAWFIENGKPKYSLHPGEIDALQALMCNPLLEGIDREIQTANGDCRIVLEGLLERFERMLDVEIEEDDPMQQSLDEMNKLLHEIANANTEAALAEVESIAIRADLYDEHKLELRSAIEQQKEAIDKVLKEGF